MEFDANLIPPALGVLGLLIVFFIHQWIKKQPSGNDAVQKLVNKSILALLCS